MSVKRPLKAHLPKGGFLWNTDANIFPHKRDDVTVQNCLKAHDSRWTTAAVTARFAEMFTKAATRLREGKLPGVGVVGQYRFLKDLRDEIPFACDTAPQPLDNGVFCRLFRICMDARQGFLNLPKEKQNLHHPLSSLALAIDDFWSVAEPIWAQDFSQLAMCYASELERKEKWGYKMYKEVWVPLPYKFKYLEDGSEDKEHNRVSELFNKAMEMVCAAEETSDLTREEHYELTNGSLFVGDFEDLVQATEKLRLVEKEIMEKERKSMFGDDDKMDLDSD